MCCSSSKRGSGVWLSCLLLVAGLKKGFLSIYLSLPAESFTFLTPSLPMPFPAWLLLFPHSLLLRSSVRVQPPGPGELPDREGRRRGARQRPGPHVLRGPQLRRRRRNLEKQLCTATDPAAAAPALPLCFMTWALLFLLLLLLGVFLLFVRISCLLRSSSTIYHFFF